MPLLCVTHSHRGCAQLGDLKLNCHSDRLSDCQDFLLIFVLGIGLVFSAADLLLDCEVSVSSSFCILAYSGLCFLYLLFNGQT